RHAIFSLRKSSKTRTLGGSCVLKRLASRSLADDSGRRIQGCLRHRGGGESAAGTAAILQRGAARAVRENAAPGRPALRGQALRPAGDAGPVRGIAEFWR